MKFTALDQNWTFRRGLLDSIVVLQENPGVAVDLPHDGMIETPVSADAPAKYDSGYFDGDLTNYTKMVTIPADWEKDCVGLYLDGAMLNATVEINGYKAALQHYGYAPFYVDLTELVSFGQENRITIHTNTAMQSNSRWYTGSGLYRGIFLVHSPRVHVVPNGIYMYTKEVAENLAFLEAQVEIKNATAQNRLVEVRLQMLHEKTGQVVKEVTRVIQINASAVETAQLDFALENPVLWDAENPNLYQVKALVKSLGVYRTHFIAQETDQVDEAETLFGIRTITADAIRGLRINGKEVKLKGGCLHHDNGLLGAVSLYEAEARKIMKLKAVGFNAIRTTHNPPSAALIEACDRLGMYVFDEAFDAWGIAKRGGDYNQYFAENWEKDLTAFVKRDRSHPSVIIWSTGNEIPERGGLNNGYTLATKLAVTVKKLDASRPVSNGICSLWSGLDDELAKTQRQEQNAVDEEVSLLYEKATEPFTNGLDIVGYNYLEDVYERDHDMFPDRVILGSENFPKEIGYRWPMVEQTPYVIGDFTWTAWDYIGEAGIGKSVHVDPDDPLVEKGPWAIMPPSTSPYPWRLANDADFDITGRMLAQGAYRSVIWGSDKTYLYSYHPSTFGQVEIMSMWGFPGVSDCWNYAGYEGQYVKLLVFSRAQEVELLIQGKSAGRKAVSKEKPMPNSVCFEVPYEPGIVEAVSYRDGKEVSRACLCTSEAASAIRLQTEKTVMRADGHDLVYVGIDVVDAKGALVSDAQLLLHASLQVVESSSENGEMAETTKDADYASKGVAYLAGFGSGNPITEENYTDDAGTSFRGRATAVIRSGYHSGKVMLTISCEGLKDASAEIEVVCP